LLRRLMDHQANCLLISHDRSFVRTVRTGSG
jgi:ATPase subunit of ABC transporter with duplicated ATPase domains